MQTAYGHTGNRDWTREAVAMLTRQKKREQNTRSAVHWKCSTDECEESVRMMRMNEWVSECE